MVDGGRLLQVRGAFPNQSDDGSHNGANRTNSACDAPEIQRINSLDKMFDEHEQRANRDA
jgi:hypothetical protein